MADRHRGHLRPVPTRPVLSDDDDGFVEMGPAVSMGAPVPATAHEVAGTAPAPATGTPPATGTGDDNPVSDTDAPVLDAGTGDGEAGEELTPGEQITIVVRHWIFMITQTLARLTTEKTGVIFGLWHAKPESCAEHHAYVSSGRWVPEAAQDAFAEFLRIAGKIDGWLIGKPLVVLGNSISGIGARPLRRFLFLIIVGAPGVIAYIHLRH
jgi:hypothetical protein